MRWLSSLCRLMLLAGMLAWAPSVLASPQPAQEAGRYLEEASAAFAAHRYAEAAAALRAAYDLDPKPAHLYSIGQAQRLNGDCTRAIESYRSFLASSPPGRQALPALQHIERCRAELEHQPRVPAEPNAPAQQLAPTSPERVAVAVVPPPTVTTVRAEPGRWQRDKLGWGLAGVGLALAITGATLTGVGEARIGAAIDATTYDEYASASPDAKSAVPLRLGGIITLSAGGAVIVGSIARFAYVAHRSQKERARDTKGGEGR